MKIKEILQRIHSAYSKGVQSDDSRLTNRHIYNKLLSTRALLLSREVNKKRKLSSWNFVTLPCVEIIEVPTNEACPCIPDTGCSVYRSKEKLPKPIVSLQSHMIRSVTNTVKNIKYAEVTLNQNIYSKGSKYATNTEKYLVDNGYLYVMSKYPPMSVRVELLPEDVMDAYNFINYCNNNTIDCADRIMEREFPIDGYLLEPLIQLTYDELISGFSRSLQDSNNNSKDDAISNFRAQNTNSQEDNNE